MIISSDQTSPEVIASKPQLSIVIPAYNEAGNLHKVYSELMKVLPFMNISWQIVFSDDGEV